MELPKNQDVHRFVVDREVPLLRLLYFTKWFRLAFLCFLVIVIGVPLALIKFWRVTPEGFRPEIHISLLDRVQAVMLRRSGVRLMEAGDGDAAIHALQSAVANYPTQLDVCRDLNRVLIQADLRRDYWETAARNSLWLLRLSETNRSDLELVVETFEHYELDGANRELLEAYDQPRTVPLERVWLKSLFLEGDVELFARGFEGADEEVFADPEMALFQTAYGAGWGDPLEASGHQEALEAAMGDPETRILAHRLQMIVSFIKVDADQYLRSLEVLEQEGLDRARHHVNYWTLLAEVGRRMDAVRLASEFAVPPRSEQEVLLYADVYTRLGLVDLAFRFLGRYASEFGHREGVWVSQARLLTAERRWDALFDLAMAIRARGAGDEALLGFSFFLEGKADFERQRFGFARNALQRISAYSLDEGSLGLFIASNLMEMGFHEYARDVLVNLRRRYGDQLTYWQMLLVAAEKIGSSVDLLAATENLYRMQPNDMATKNNYAGILLSLRIRPEEAISLTFRVMNQDASNTSARINHAHALLLNERIEEAEALLNTINPKPLIPPLQHAYLLARLEIAVVEENWEQARSLAEGLQPEHLLPGDADRYRELAQAVRLRQMPGVSAPLAF